MVFLKNCYLVALSYISAYKNRANPVQLATPSDHGYFLLRKTERWVDLESVFSEIIIDNEYGNLIGNNKIDGNWLLMDLTGCLIEFAKSQSIPTDLKQLVVVFFDSDNEIPVMALVGEMPNGWVFIPAWPTTPCQWQKLGQFLSSFAGKHACCADEESLSDEIIQHFKK